jgi:GrpB-like predicted nucleotidyltransferase (UPF0157 family)
MLGLKKGSVALFPHHEHWHELFAEEKARLQNAIGENILAIEHIGSTSICGISAKPIIDICAAFNENPEAEKCIAPLVNLGYEYRGEHGIAGRYYFVKGEPRTHHLHIVKIDSDFWRSHLLFRDYLRRNSAVAKEYDNLKQELANKHAKNRDAYLEGKAEFIENVLSNAGFIKTNFE